MSVLRELSELEAELTIVEREARVVRAVLGPHGDELGDAAHRLRRRVEQLRAVLEQRERAAALELDRRRQPRRRRTA